MEGNVSYKCLRPGPRTHRNCGTCRPCRAAMKLVVAWVEDEDRRQPKGRRAPRLAAATGMAEAEAQMRLTAFYVSRGRKRDEEGLDDEEPRGPDGCARCGLRGEHVCLEAVATVGSSAVALLGAV